MDQPDPNTQGRRRELRLECVEQAELVVNRGGQFSVRLVAPFGTC
jgi:hypothetical protein